MRIPRFSHVCFVLFLAAIGQILVASEKQDKTVSRSAASGDESDHRNRWRFHVFSKKEFKCLWRCEVNESDLSTRLNTAFTEGNKLISFIFAFPYPKKVDEKCVNLTLDKSIGGNDKQWNYSSWQIFLIDRKLPSSVNNAMKRFSSWIEAHVRVHVNVSCNFTANSSNSQRPRGELSSHAYLEKILRSTAASLGELCDTEVEQNSQQPCIEINEVSWAKDRWTIFSALGCFVFVTLSPVVCLFAATEDTHEGFRQITVEGPSPVGFRSLIGNYFFSSDCTLWHMVRKFIMRVVILPLPFLVPAVFIEYLLYKNVLSSQISVKERTHLFRPFKMVCYACYCFQAFYFYFIIGKTNCTRSCVDEFDRDDKHLNVIWLCYDRELPQRMLTRVHIVRCFLWIFWATSPCNWFVTDLIQEAKTCSCSPCTVSISSFRKFFWSIIFYLAVCILCACVMFIQLSISFWYIVAIAILSPFAVICPSVSSSLWQLMDVNFLHRYILFPVRLVVILLDI